MEQIDIDNQFRKACGDLNIYCDNRHQDWGIEYADAKRVDEFMDYFTNNIINEHLQVDLFELIIASYNDAIVAGINNKQLQDKFLKVVNEVCKKNNNLIFIRDHWVENSDDDMFPVGKILSY